jgi:hypothetical protein
MLMYIRMCIDPAARLGAVADGFTCTYADVCGRMRDICCRMLTYADVHTYVHTYMLTVRTCLLLTKEACTYVCTSAHMYIRQHTHTSAYACVYMLSAY